jgi:hypothetical protein
VCGALSGLKRPGEPVASTGGEPGVAGAGAVFPAPACRLEALGRPAIVLRVALRLLAVVAAAVVAAAPALAGVTAARSGGRVVRPSPRELFDALGEAAPVQQSELPAAFSYPLTQDAGSAPAGFIGEIDTSVLPVDLNIQLSDLLAIDVASSTEAAVAYISRNGLVVQSDGVTAIASPVSVPHHAGLFRGAAATMLGDALIRTSAYGTTRAAARAASVVLLRGGIGYFRVFERASDLASAPEVHL